jgi:hypothetical protein
MSHRQQGEVLSALNTIGLKTPDIEGKYFLDTRFLGENDERGIGKIHWDIFVFRHERRGSLKTCRRLLYARTDSNRDSILRANCMMDGRTTEGIIKVLVALSRRAFGRQGYGEKGKEMRGCRQ